MFRSLLERRKIIAIVGIMKNVLELRTFTCLAQSVNKISGSNRVQILRYVTDR